MFHNRKRGSSPARRDVPDDWLAVLPREQSQTLDSIVRRWECSYAMMSVALDDALSLRARGDLVCARQQVQITRDLMGRFVAALVAACNCIAETGKLVTDLPSVEPLKAEFFRGDTAQSAASWNELLHHVLFGGRARFFHKIRILSSTIEQLGREFDEAATDLAAGLSHQPGAQWTTLDFIHYDLNTCLREAEVVLKAFMRALSPEQLSPFATEMSKVPARKKPDQPRLSRASA